MQLTPHARSELRTPSPRNFFQTVSHGRRTVMIFGLSSACTGFTRWRTSVFKHNNKPLSVTLDDGLSRPQHSPRRNQSRKNHKRAVRPMRHNGARPSPSQGLCAAAQTSFGYARNVTIGCMLISPSLILILEKERIVEIRRVRPLGRQSSRRENRSRLECRGIKLKAPAKPNDRSTPSKISRPSLLCARARLHFPKNRLTGMTTVLATTAD